MFNVVCSWPKQQRWPCSTAGILEALNCQFMVSRGAGDSGGGRHHDSLRWLPFCLLYAFLQKFPLALVSSSRLRHASFFSQNSIIFADLDFG